MKNTFIRHRLYYRYYNLNEFYIIPIFQKADLIQEHIFLPKEYYNQFCPF